MMLDNLLLHPVTKRQLGNFYSNPKHSLLLSGEAGGGKKTAALNLAALLLGRENLSNLALEPNFLHIRPNPATISIDDIRSLKKFLSLKTPGKNQIRRAVVIEQADSMTAEAQNALLKLLEEPPADTVLVLTADNSSKLLPTITSRAPMIEIKPVSLKSATDFFKSSHAANKIEKAHLLSEGAAGLLSSLLEQDKTHPLVESIEKARVLISGSSFSRLGKVDEIARDKDNLPLTLLALRKLIHAALANAISKNDRPGTVRLNKTLNEILEAETATQKNANAKLLITNLLINV